MNISLKNNDTVVFSVASKFYGRRGKYISPFTPFGVSESQTDLALVELDDGRIIFPELSSLIISGTPWV